MTLFLTAIIIALIFYVLLPLLGAFSVRSKWRRFRRMVISGSLMNELSYSEPSRRESGYAGAFRFLGDLQAIQNNSSVWLNSGSLSVRAELEGVRIYLLPASESMETEGRLEHNENILPQDMPKRLSWEQVYSLAQGTGFFLAGSVYIENGSPVFRNSEENPLLVVIYDGSRESILRRSIWCGRQKNEYWNPVTPAALLAGIFALFVTAYMMFRQTDYSLYTMIVTLLSIFPVLPFVPPGVLFYYIFRRLWQKGRVLRAERDLLRLPLRFFDSGCRGAEGHCRCLSEKSYSDAVEKYPAAVIRSCGLIEDPEDAGEYSIFVSDDSSAAKDPFFEQLIIPGDAAALSDACRARARVMELAAGASISTAFIVNSILLLFIFLRLI